MVALGIEAGAEAKLPPEQAAGFALSDGVFHVEED